MSVLEGYIVNIIVRPYNQLDYTEMLEITMALWNYKMAPYTKRDFLFNMSIIDDTKTIPRTLNEGILVAEIDGVLAGVVHLDFKGKKVSKHKRVPLYKLIYRYGLLRLLRVRRMGFFLNIR